MAIFETLPTQVDAEQIISIRNAVGSTTMKVFEFAGDRSIFSHRVSCHRAAVEGDYVVFLDKDDIYHCPKAVFENKYRAVV